MYNSAAPQNRLLSIPHSTMRPVRIAGAQKTGCFSHPTAQCGQCTQQVSSNAKGASLQGSSGSLWPKQRWLLHLHQHANVTFIYSKRRMADRLRDLLPSALFTKCSQRPELETSNSILVSTQVAKMLVLGTLSTVFPGILGGAELEAN